MAPRLKWNIIVVEAAQIVTSYSTSVTLRQLFYRLVSRGSVPNTQSAYKTLSKVTAEARREGWFPDLIDRTRSIEKWQDFSDPGQAQRWLAAIYRRDRSDNQEQQIFIGVEKAGMVVQLQSWFSDYGLPIIALSGYSSQTFVKTVGESMMGETYDNDRPSHLIYAGDFDPSGEDIDRDFVERLEEYIVNNTSMLLSDVFAGVERIALLPEHIEEYQLPEYPGKETDSRKWEFIEKHGKLVQVELDALDPDDLHILYKTAVDEYFDYDVYEAVVEEEQKDEEILRRLSDKIMDVRAEIEEEE
ncbi:hypothetical protein LCGC14_1806620 [marine sediment metagenome]|uniref:Uncharacterized protein n=1 Tax=marine sediment metagenome TaxID=412755 RepID=A0A0F9JMP9_9ZZZZ